MKKILLCSLCLIGLLWQSCATKEKTRSLDLKHFIINNAWQLNTYVQPITPPTTLPQLHSAATAMYGGYWIFMGGRKSGFHGTSGYPIPFSAAKANDSIWVVDIGNSRSWAIQVPAEYQIYLSSSNPAFYQVQDLWYYCGGFTVSDTAQKNSNWTSDHLFEINLPNLIEYVKSGGQTPVLENVFTKVIQNPLLQVTGGEMAVVNNNFYLIGGQNFIGIYSPGNSGVYTNAIRKFNLAGSGNAWTIANVDSLKDSVNLHRRDFTLVPVLTSGSDSIRFSIYGGVFTRKDLAYRQPVLISGLGAGTPAITVDTLQQKVNQYSCAYIPFIAQTGASPIFGFTTLLGGISYMEYDSIAHSLVIGDKGIPMPFSNLVSIVTSNDQSVQQEFIQLPSQPLLPGYIGSNASFFPIQNYLYGGQLNILDYSKLQLAGPPVLIGYMLGGILSDGPTSGTTPKKHVNTYVNPNIYGVYMQLTQQNK